MWFPKGLPRQLPKRPLCVLIGLFCATILFAQEKSPSEAPPQVLRSITRLVLVDTVVVDKQGRHVTNLTRDDFILLEHGKPQKIDVFSTENTALPTPEQGPPPSPQPPHVFTNRPDTRRPEGPPTFLLLDGLNTSVRDQNYVRDRMLRYIQKQLQQGQRSAVLALNDSLLLLQDFTDDPKLLLAALEKYSAKKSAAMSQGEPRTLTQTEVQAMSGTNLVQIIDRMNQSRAVDSIEARAGITLAALRSIARAAAGFPGRKNLVWVSSAFPVNLVPGDGSRTDLYRDFTDDMRRTEALLAAAQVAVYPVDARGLSVGDVTGSRTAGLVQTVGTPGGPSGEEQLTQNNEVVLGSHAAMQELAEETGGIAFYNNNQVDHAVALSIADGSQYYTLGYYPEDGNWDGKFHRIEVKVKREGVKLRYRRGYYAVDPARGFTKESPKERNQREYEEIQAALADPMPATGVTFRVYVPPPGHDGKVQVNFLVDARTLFFEEVEQGLHRSNVDFMVAAISPEGKVIASDGKTLDARLRPELYTRAQQQGLPLSMHLQLAPGNYMLRLAVRDNRTKLVGTLTAPLSFD